MALVGAGQKLGHSPVSPSSCYLLFIGENSKFLVFHCNSAEWCAMKMPISNSLYSFKSNYELKYNLHCLKK